MGEFEKKKSRITKNRIKQQRGTVVGKKSQQQQGKKMVAEKRSVRKKKRKKTVRGQFFEPFLGLSFIFSANASLGVAFFDFFFSAGGSSRASARAARPCKITKGTNRGSEAKSTKLPISRRGLYLFLHWGLLWRRNVLRT